MQTNVQQQGERRRSELFETVVAWGRSAELIDYDQDTHRVFVQEAEDAVDS